MMANRRSIFIVLVLSMVSALAFAQAVERTGAPGKPDTTSKLVILESRVSRLQLEFDAVAELESSTAQRRSYKKIIRRAETRIGQYARAPERFRLFGLIFESQKMLFAMQSTSANQKALLQTAKRLLEAPDEYATLRVEPDMLFMQLELSTKESTPDSRALAVARFADRYRDTPAESRSLMIASSITFDLGHRILLQAFRRTLTRHFGHEPLVNAFLRERFAANGDVHLPGTFTRVDGRRISFPIGQTYVVCFWSLSTPLLKAKLAEIKALQDRRKAQFKVFSFNLDELPDGGKGALKRMKLDWIPLQLPGGVDNPIYLSVGRSNLFSVLLVDPHGLAAVDAAGRPTPLHKKYEAAAGSPRHLALLRSLCIGDFLVIDPFGPVDFKAVPESKIFSRIKGVFDIVPLVRTDISVPLETLHAIQARFAVPPMRYRLSPDAALKQYEKAEQSCRDAIAQHGNAPDLWIVHNRRIIALLGMWRLSGESEYLERAVASAKAALAMDLPPGAGTVPHFCIATKALRKEDADIAQVLSAFIDASGGLHAPGSACAAALMLSLDAHSRVQYLKYRDLLLNRYIEDPSTWWVASFLLDGSSSSRLFGRESDAVQ